MSMWTWSETSRGVERDAGLLALELSFLGTRCTCEDVQLSPLPVVLLSKPEHVPASCLIYGPCSHEGV